jgi:hypothetical protein
MSVGLKSEVADANESAWQHVTQKPPDEVARVDGHYAPSVASPSIAIAEGDLAVLESDKALIADSDAVCVAAEIPQNLFRAGHRRLTVDHPLLRGGLAEQPLAQWHGDA